MELGQQWPLVFVLLIDLGLWKFFLYPALHSKEVYFDSDDFIVDGFRVDRSGQQVYILGYSLEIDLKLNLVY